MRLKKPVLILLIFLMLFLTIGSVSALENQTDDCGENEILSVSESPQNQICDSGENEIIGAGESPEISSGGQYNYTYLKEQIGSGGNITLTKGSYTYDNDGDTIEITDSCVINGNGAVIDMAKSGHRAFYIKASEVTIANLTIKNANFNGNGGAVYFEDSGTVINCNFMDNEGTNGGAVYFEDSGTVINCNFMDNEGTFGGAVCFPFTGEVTNCNFINNTATNGGAIFLGDGRVENCNFIDNTATDNGGAIDCYACSVENCNFTCNSASNNGHAISFSSGSVTNCNFANVKFGVHDENSYLTLTLEENLDYTNTILATDAYDKNNLKYWNGSSYVTGDSPNFGIFKTSNLNISFEIYNSSGALLNKVTQPTDNNGQTVYDYLNLSDEAYTYKLYLDSEPSIYTSGIFNHGDFNILQTYISRAQENTIINLTRNFTYTKGLDDNLKNGIVINRDLTIYGNCHTISGSNTARIFKVNTKDNVVFHDITFTNGNATGDNNMDNLGGAICAQSNTIAVNCTFNNNHAKNYGGAMEGGAANNCTFNNNTSIFGGAIHNGQANNCTFNNNTADLGGAMIYGTANNCTFNNNHANSFGGAIHKGQANNCTFNNNTATTGGAIIEGNANHCTFNNNHANEYGGAMDTSAANHCTFNNNTATYGGAMYSGTANQCTFNNNTAENGGAMIYGTANNCTFNNNTANNGAAIYYDYAENMVFSGRFINNQGNSTIYIEEIDENVLIKDSIFINNTGNNIEVENTYHGASVKAPNNWFGNNASNYNTSMANVMGYVEIESWLFLNATANPNTIAINDSSEINFKLESYNLGETSDYDNTLINPVNLKITATKGKTNTTQTSLDNPIKYTSNSPGTASITASIENIAYTITVTTPDGTTFWDLNRTINNNTDTEIILNKNYTFNSTVDSGFVDGIVIDRPVTINGNGHTINALQKARIFKVTASSINITGLTFKNGKADDGGAIYFANDISNSSINATFINNTATNGGANYFQDNVTDSNIMGTYTSNKATSNDGGANYFEGSVSDSNINGTYTSNTAGGWGGANYFEGSVSDSNITGTYTSNNATNGGANYFISVSNSTITGTYTNNTATNGGANNFEDSVSNSTITGTYTNNTAGQWGGANYFRNTVSCSTITGTYTNNTAGQWGGANYFRNTVSCSTITGTYTNNTATNGGANSFLDTVSNSNITGTYTNNTAGTWGGANSFISVSNSTITGTYTNNNAADSGGANNFVRIVSGSTIAGTYTGNNATNGGANHFVSSVSDSNITGTYTGNNATNGGANHFMNTVLYSTINGTYTGNNATNGGANHFWNNVLYSNIGGTYINNTATNATIHFQDYNNRGLDAQVNNAIFLNNNCTYEIYASKPGVVVKDSWFGNNASNFMNKPNVNENVTIDNWLFLNATADYTSISILDSSNITFKLKSTNGTSVSDFDNSKFPPVNLTLTAANGDADNTTTLDNIVKYKATGPGKGSITAKIENASYTIYFYNNLRNADLSVSGENITYPENEILTLTYNSTATGKVNITLKSKKYNKTIERTINQTVTIADLPAGEYEIIIEYLGDNVFSNATAYANFTVKKITTEVIPDNETIDLFVDDEFKITYTLKPENALGNISFSSDDSSIASVNSTSGDITAKSEGSANITLSFSGSENYTASNATITVNVKKIPTQITVNSPHIDMKVNEKADTGASLKPANAGNLTYTSSDENIVKVKDGKIIALKEGNATITVSFKGNNKYAEAENKTINVTVNLNDASVSVNNRTLDLLVDSTFTIVATTTPKGLNVSFVPDDSGVYSIDENGNVIGLREGEGSILIKVGGDGIYALNSTTVNVTVSKIPTEITVLNDTLALEVSDEIAAGATLTPPDAGNITYTISNSTVVKVEDEKIIALSEGEATITVSFKGDEKYLKAENKTINVTVHLNDASVSVNNNTLDLLVDDTFNLVATTNPKDLTVNFTSSNSSVVTVDENGNVKAISEGTATITLSVGGDGVYALNSTTVTVTVSKVPTEITVDYDSLDLFVGDETIIAANLIPSDAGNVTFTSSNDSVVTVDDLGNVIAQGKGHAIITVSFAGDSKYAAAENKTITVDVSLNPASVTVDNDTLDLKVDETFTINATKNPDTILLDITYNSSDDTVAKVDENGIVTAVGEGTAVITLSVGDDEIYAENSTTVTVTVSKIPTEISVLNDTIDLEVGDETVAGASLTPADAGNLTYKSSDENIVKVKDGKIIALGEGTAIITVSFAGNDKYAAAEDKSIDITVSLKNTTISISAPEITEGENTTVTVTLPENATGSVTIGNETIPVENGTASAVLTNLPAGNTTLPVTYSGDDKYNPIESSVTVTVNEKPVPDVNVTLPEEITAGDTATADIELPSDATGNVTVKDNGKTIATAQLTDGKAKISMSLESGTHELEITYSGDDKYAPATTTKTVTANKITTHILVDESFKRYSTDCKAGETGGNITAYLLDENNNPLSNMPVQFTVNGKTYNLITNDTGAFSLQINLKMPKTYAIALAYNGDDKYNATTATSKLIIVQKKTSIKTSDKTFRAKTKTKTIHVTLKTVKNQFSGKTYIREGKKLTLVVKGKRYTKHTDAKGIAIFTVKLRVKGTYTAKITFEGDKIYTASTKKIKITIK